MTTLILSVLLCVCMAGNVILFLVYREVKNLLFERMDREERVLRDHLATMDLYTEALAAHGELIQEQGIMLDLLVKCVPHLPAPLERQVKAGLAEVLKTALPRVKKTEQRNTLHDDATH